MLRLRFVLMPLKLRNKLICDIVCLHVIQSEFNLTRSLMKNAKMMVAVDGGFILMYKHSTISYVLYNSYDSESQHQTIGGSNLRPSNQP